MENSFSILGSFLSTYSRQIALVSAYIVLSRLCLVIKRNDFKYFYFAVCNLFIVLLLYTTNSIRSNAVFLLYIFIILFDYYLIKLFYQKEKFFYLIPFLFPIFLLIVVKYLMPFIEFKYRFATFLGISYMTLRLSYLVVELRNESVKFPTLFEFLSFTFFFPTIIIGPISTFNTFSKSFIQKTESKRVLWDSFVRIFIGLGKYSILSQVFHRFTFEGMWYDGYMHTPFDFLTSCVFYYLYLYCNFSGFCDMMIGISKLAGIQVQENFNAPLTARNIKDFWNRWHITLSQYVRDVLFTPLSKQLVAFFGPKSVNHVIAGVSLIVFLMVGIWHGYGLNFILFGLFHAVGLIINNYYAALLRNYFPKAVVTYNKNRLIKILSTCLTFVFVSLSFFFFENDYTAIKNILSLLV